MKHLRFAASFAALVFVGTAASASPPGGPGKSSPGAHFDRDDRHHRLDRWRYDWFDRGFGFRCRGPGGFEVCVRPVRPLHPYSYGLILPPTGHEYLPDDWPFNLPAYDPGLLYPYWTPTRRERAPFTLESPLWLNDCPDGVQRCHEDEQPNAEEERSR